MPWWLLFANRRPPGVGAADYPRRAQAAAAGKGDPKIADVMACSGPLYDRLLGPFFLAALNSDPDHRLGRARRPRPCARPWCAAGAPAIRSSPRTACRAPSSIPALKLLRRGGAQVRFERRLRGLAFAENRASPRSSSSTIRSRLSAQDMVVLATPAQIADDARAGPLSAADLQRHSQRAFQRRPAQGNAADPRRRQCDDAMAVRLPDRLSVTVSDANRFMEAPREELAATIWREVAALTGLSDATAVLARSSRSAARPSRRRPKKTPAARRAARNGAI